MSIQLIRNLILMVLMVAALVGASIWKPTHRLAQELGPIQLDSLVPVQFAEWREVPQAVANIVNPQQQETIERIYSQTLSRTYVNAQGEYIMLSIAYGEDQSDANQLHLPDVCYPAQGFQVRSSEKGTLETEFGSIRVKRLVTFMGSRIEPLTYWTTVGGSVVSGATETKIAQLKYGLRSTVPDGLIFRVSTITSDTEHAFEVQKAFVKEFLQILPVELRARVAGI
ncbi:exosortase-associated protein EpsI, B-type [Methylobacillus sp.]|uniref:exosortase-associated protein EpsI, B-type n=1 Tax=Methylobacillus sp. TaxID=56818 RepID=UPI002FE3FCB4